MFHFDFRVLQTPPGGQLVQIHFDTILQLSDERRILGIRLTNTKCWIRRKSRRIFWRLNTQESSRMWTKRWILWAVLRTFPKWWVGIFGRSFWMRILTSATLFKYRQAVRRRNGWHWISVPTTYSQSRFSVMWNQRPAFCWKYDVARRNRINQMHRPKSHKWKLLVP